MIHIPTPALVIFMVQIISVFEVVKPYLTKEEMGVTNHIVNANTRKEKSNLISKENMYSIKVTNSYTTKF